MKKIIILVLGVITMTSNLTAAQKPCAETIAIAMIAKEEGFRSEWYRCSANKRTIGYGFTASVLTTEQQNLKTMDRKTADHILGKMVRKLLAEVNAEVAGLNLTENQKAVLVSLAWNIGMPSLKKSTMMKRIKARDTNARIIAGLKMWNKIHDKSGNLVVSNGLTLRREREAAKWIA